MQGVQCISYSPLGPIIAKISPLLTPAEMPHKILLSVTSTQIFATVNIVSLAPQFNISTQQTVPQNKDLSFLQMGHWINRNRGTVGSLLAAFRTLHIFHASAALCVPRRCLHQLVLY